MLLNSCVNPVVYATTIPAFKALIKRFFSCDKQNDVKSTRKPNDRKDAMTKSKEEEEEEVSLGSNT